MGNLLKVLHSREPESPTSVDLFVDFENAQPTVLELGVWTQVNTVLGHCSEILMELNQYGGASEQIRNAISNPNTEDCQEQAWSTLLPLVLQLKRYYEFSMDLESTVPNLLTVLCSNEMTPRQHLDTQQALFKQFAQILDFTLKFDDLKMLNPAIQNDFSYYRRTLSKRKMSCADEPEIEGEVNHAMANRMSLFYAHATPMLKVLSDTTTKFVTENKDLPIANTTVCLSTIAGICRIMIENPKYRMKIANNETVMFCLRVMVAAIILYDHVHPDGAFVKSSNINIKNSIKVLKEHAPEKVDCLLNALRYTTKHFGDETTPKSVKSLLS